MKISIWIYENELENLIKGEVVKYFEREPGAFEHVLQVWIDSDTYYKLKDGKNGE
jgi:hypothetical protein